MRRCKRPGCPRVKRTERIGDYECSEAHRPGNSRTAALGYPLGYHEGVNEGHSYPRELVAFVVEHWEAAGAELGPSEVSYHPHETLPHLPTLERLLSTCYQASLMREEERSVSFRLILAAPSFSHSWVVLTRACSGWSSLRSALLTRTS
jgi:Probable sensor domain DACNV